MERQNLEAKPTKAEERSTPREPPSAKPLVLVATDDPATLTALSGALCEHYRVILSASAADALASWDPEIAAVILDIKMPAQGGPWPGDAIKKVSDKVPVIFHAAVQDINDHLDIIHQHQPFAYVTKGTDALALKQTLDQAIRYAHVVTENKKVVAELQELRARMQGLSTSIK